jgi:hypothetical protein
MAGAVGVVAVFVGVTLRVRLPFWGEAVPARCKQSDSDLVASDEPGLELALDGRILSPAYQMAWLVNEGLYPAEVWLRDPTAPNVRCFVFHSPTKLAARDVLVGIDAHFPPAVTEGGFRLLKAR